MNLRPILIYVCFFLSGAAGLIYQVVWARQLSLFLGITSYANTAVISAYMLGLAAGSWWFGKRADQMQRPLRFYAWLEISIALFAAATPWLFAWLQTGYASWAGEAGLAGSGAHLARFAVALAALLLPTFLMGGTLPLLVRGITRSLPQLGPVTGRLYGINTLGATLGTALTGFVLLPRLGVTLSIAAGVAFNLAAAVFILLLMPNAVVADGTTAQTESSAASPKPALALSSMQKQILLLGFATAGFAALLTQLAWIRAMVLVVGGSVYAFTITLTAFLAGIGLGSLVYGIWLSRQHDNNERFQLASMLAFLTGLFTLLSLSLIAQLPAWFLRGYAAGWVQDFGLYRVFMFALSFVVMFVPTLLMGALFPLLAVIRTSSLQGAGRDIGTAYAVNALGTVLGALLGGLVLLPLLGIHYSIYLACGLYCLIAAAFLLAGKAQRPMATALAASALIVAISITPAWDRYQMATNAFYAPETRLQNMATGGRQETQPRSRLLYYQEGLDGVAAVIFDGDQKSLTINGKLEASNVSNLPTQIGLGQIATLMHPDPRNALIIGLGSGITAGSLAMHGSIESVSVLEISPEVIEAARYFAEDNHNVLSNPKLELVAADARNYALATRRQWDLIISQPSEPGTSGVSNLFTADFFRLMKTRLAAGGVMAQWFNIYGVSDSDVQTVLSDFGSNFRYVTVWNTQTGDLIMIGSDELNGLDLRRLQQAFADQPLRTELSRAGITTTADLIQLYLISSDRLADYVMGAETNTDDRPRIEFSTPRSFYTGSTKDVLKAIIGPVAGARLSVPLQHTYHQTDSELQIHGVNLSVASNPEAGFSGINSNWWQTRQIAEPDGSADFTVATVSEMTWSEGRDQFSIETIEDTYLPTVELRLQVLQGNLYSPVAIAQGSIVRQSDPYALWTAASGAVGLEVALFFTCPLPGGVSNWFVVRQTKPDSMGQNPAVVAATLSSRLKCL